MTSIYYGGTVDDWSEISIVLYNSGLSDNSGLFIAKIYFGYTGSPGNKDNQGNGGDISNVCASGKHNYIDKVCTVCGNLKPSEGLEYKLNSDGKSYTVSDVGTCIDTDIVIPSYYEGLPVTCIGDNAFSGCRSLTNVAIPENIDSIESQAFAGCASLESIEIPESVTSIHIGRQAFSGCTSLTSVTLSNSVTYIGEAAFLDCTSLVSVAIPDNIRFIEPNTFDGCTSLYSIIIPDTVAFIRSSAFNYCFDLRVVLYCGTRDDWDKISSDGSIIDVYITTRFYYSETKPTTSGNFWRYDENGEIVVW